MHQQPQAEISAQLETLLDTVCAAALPVADRLELRRLADALCHASKVTGEPVSNRSRVDAAVAALKLFKANLKRRTDAKDGLTSKRLIDLSDDARAILLSSIAFIFRDELEKAVLNGLKTHLMQPDAYRAFVEEFTREYYARENAVEHERASLETKLTKVKADIKKIDRRDQGWRSRGSAAR